MRNIQEVIQEKEARIVELRKQMKALKLVAQLLDETPSVDIRNLILSEIAQA